MKSAVITLSNAGACAAKRIADALSSALFVHENVSLPFSACRFSSLWRLTENIFNAFDGLIYIAPTGAVLRVIAPFVVYKKTDPAVVVADVGARYAISLLSGHEGGANALTVTVSNILGAEPVITTTSEAQKNLIVGVGCRRGVSLDAIRSAVYSALDALGESLSNVRFLASADIKSDEAGLLAAAASMHLPLRFIESEAIRRCCLTFQHSGAAERHVDLPAVAEPAALLAGRRTTLVLSKQTLKQVTVAVAREDFTWSASAPATASIERDAPNR